MRWQWKSLDLLGIILCKSGNLRLCHVDFLADRHPYIHDTKNITNVFLGELTPEEYCAESQNTWIRILKQGTSRPFRNMRPTGKLPGITGSFRF